MPDEFHEILKKYPLIASKNPQLNLLNEEELIELEIQRSSLYKKIWNRQKKNLARFSVNTEVRKYVEPADRFRDITRTNFAEPEHSIKWPVFDLSTTTNGAGEPRSDANHLTAMRTLEQGKELQRLLEKISQQLALALSRPGLAFEDRYSIRVEFLECIAWVALKVERVIKMEVKDSKGNWQLSTFRFNLLRPMQTITWVDQVLLAWVGTIVTTFREDAEKAYDWLRAQLGERFHNETSLHGIRQQVRHHMSVDSGMIEALLHIKRQAGMRQALMSTEISKVWPVAEYWAELYRKYPDLTLLCHLAASNRKVRPIRNVDELRSTFLKNGLSPSGWRFLLKEGEASYRAVIKSGMSEATVFPLAIGLIEWQSRSGLKGPMPREMAVAFLNFAAMALLEGMNIADYVDPRIAKIAVEHFYKLEQARDRAEFVEREWLETLIWLRNKQPKIDKNQWKSGWPCIWRKYLAGLSDRDTTSEWESLVGDISFLGMQVKPLTSSKELCLEGMKMKHCVSSYAKDCRDGVYRVFSIQETVSVKRVATVGLRCKDGFWALDQVKGKANRKVGSELESVSNSLARFYQQTHLQYSSRPIAPANGESNQAKLRGDSFFQLKVSNENCLMARNSEGVWEFAQCSEYPISPELRSGLESGNLEGSESVNGTGIAELTLRLRLELPPEFAVYIWDAAKNQNRLLRVDS